MSEPLLDVQAIRQHLKESGADSIIPGAYVAMQACIIDFDALVHIQFRQAQTVRVSVSLPVRILPELHVVYAAALLELNRTGLGCSVVMSSTGVSVYAPILLGDGPLTAVPLDHAIALVLERATAALPVVRRIQSKALDSL